MNEREEVWWHMNDKDPGARTVVGFSTFTISHRDNQPENMVHVDRLFQVLRSNFSSASPPETVRQMANHNHIPALPSSTHA